MNCVCVCRCVYSAAVWYYNHLAGGMDIVMITEDQDAVAEYSSLHSGVYVISVQVRYHSQRRFGQLRVLLLQSVLQWNWNENMSVQFQGQRSVLYVLFHYSANKNTNKHHINFYVQYILMVLNS